MIHPLVAVLYVVAPVASPLRVQYQLQQCSAVQCHIHRGTGRDNGRGMRAEHIHTDTLSLSLCAVYLDA